MSVLALFLQFVATAATRLARSRCLNSMLLFESYNCLPQVTTDTFQGPASADLARLKSPRHEQRGRWLMACVLQVLHLLVDVVFWQHQRRPCLVGVSPQPQPPRPRLPRPHIVHSLAVSWAIISSLASQLELVVGLSQSVGLLLALRLNSQILNELPTGSSKKTLACPNITCSRLVVINAPGNFVRQCRCSDGGGGFSK